MKVCSSVAILGKFSGDARSAWQLTPGRGSLSSQAISLNPISWPEVFSDLRLHSRLSSEDIKVAVGIPKSYW